MRKLLLLSCLLLVSSYGYAVKPTGNMSTKIYNNSAQKILSSVSTEKCISPVGEYHDRWDNPISAEGGYVTFSLDPKTANNTACNYSAEWSYHANVYNEAGASIGYAYVYWDDHNSKIEITLHEKNSKYSLKKISCDQTNLVCSFSVDDVPTAE